MQVGKTYTFTFTAKVTEVRASDDDEYYDGPTNKMHAGALIRIRPRLRRSSPL